MDAIIRPSRRALLALGAIAAGAVALPQTASAQAWPQKPVTLIVSQSAGASPDVMARMVADRLSRRLGQGVVIENKPGGANVIGATAAARAAPDGYTFFFATSAAMVSNPFLIEKMTYDPIKDFAPVTLVTRSHQVIVAHPDTQIKTLAELIAYDKKEPGKLSIAVDSARNLAGVTAQALNRRAGLNLVLVPYPNINAGLQDTIAGRAGIGIFSMSIVETQIREGALRALALASNKRADNMPEVPAAAETIPGFDFSGWFMLMAPTGTPPAIIQKMNAEIREVVKDERIREMGPKLGFGIETGTPEEAANFLREQTETWRKITTELGLKAQ
ncbi:MAG: tripartite tricarboxylate transporter substrate binding protein [Beijerinckiaceae bacterium]|nr:tripartite tricarboxylate transporter substrate binding protein [Beijerinckiaceae bacterium]